MRITCKLLLIALVAITVMWSVDGIPDLGKKVRVTTAPPPPEPTPAEKFRRILEQKALERAQRAKDPQQLAALQKLKDDEEDRMRATVDEMLADSQAEVDKQVAAEILKLKTDINTQIFNLNGAKVGAKATACSLSSQFIDDSTKRETDRLAAKLKDDVDTLTAAGEEKKKALSAKLDKSGGGTAVKGTVKGT
jgi:hypothetical protein